MLFPFYQKSLSPYFWNNRTDVKTNEKFLFLILFLHKRFMKLFTKEVNLFCSWAWPNMRILDPFVMEVWKNIQYRGVGSVFHGSASVAIPMNITAGILFKIDPSGLQQKCIPGDFPQFVELPLLRTDISCCFQSAREAADSRIFTKYLAKQRWRSLFNTLKRLRKLCENSKNMFFPKRALRVSFWSLSFGLRFSFILLQGYRKV